MARKPLTTNEAKEAIRRASTMSEAAKPPVVFNGKKQLFFEARTQPLLGILLRHIQL